MPGTFSHLRTAALLAIALLAAPVLAAPALAAPALAAPVLAHEHNPVRSAPPAIGPEASRLIVGFKSTASTASVETVVRRQSRLYHVRQAQTSATDAQALVRRVGLAVHHTAQITPSLHVLYLTHTLYGANVLEVLDALRADPAVAFAAVDGHRYALQVTPNDPLFAPSPAASPPASGQWYFENPASATASITAGGVLYPDNAAIDAVDAWSITEGSSGIVIADVDTGVRFDHPDLLRAGLGGRLLPGYDFVGQDYNPNSPYNGLGTYLQANDGDGWDPDPSDPGDWISTQDQTNQLFPASNCPVADSSWHGTRVMGILGALANNDVGITGLTWGPWILPVRALGKCGGYDSNIIAGIQWAAGLPVTDPDTGVSPPLNPYPADIINLSLGGGTDACSSSGNGAAYFNALPQVVAAGALVIVAAGNDNGPVNLPGDCATVIPGVMAVAGLRNVGTKVGYSSFGAQVSVAAPAGNCVATSGDCLRSLDTTTNLGTTTPLAGASGNGYTNELSVNLGTSFATPIVSGVAALMRSVNFNLTPAQLAARLEASATAFPAATDGAPTCPTTDPNSGECACPPSGQCGSGMVNAHAAVLAAQDPIAAVKITPGSSVTLDAGGSAAACGRSIASYAWSAGSGVTIVSGANSAQAVVAGSGTVTLTVTDDASAQDQAQVLVSGTSATSAAPVSAGSASTACPKAIAVQPAAPVITQVFAPATVAPQGTATLTLTLSNANAYALTQSAFTDTLPSGLSVATAPAASTTCGGAQLALTAAAGSISLSNAVIPAKGSCTVTATVTAGAAGSYTNTIVAQGLTSGPAGASTAASTATLKAATPPSSGGGGGSLGLLEITVLGLLLGAGAGVGGGRVRGVPSGGLG